MRLTELQNTALYNIYEQGGIFSSNGQFHLNTLNSLVNRGLAKFTQYANGELCEISDLGLEYIQKESKNF